MGFALSATDGGVRVTGVSGLGGGSRAPGVGPGFTTAVPDNGVYGKWVSVSQRKAARQKAVARCQTDSWSVGGVGPLYFRFLSAQVTP